MSDLSFVAGEFPRLAATSREAAEAVRSARPEGGAKAFASAMPGTPLSSVMQGAEETIADEAMHNARGLEEAADSLEAAERDFVAAEDENGQLIGSIMAGHYGRANRVAVGHSRGGVADGGWEYIGPFRLRKRGDGRGLRDSNPVQHPPRSEPEPDKPWVPRPFTLTPTFPPVGGKGIKAVPKPFSSELGGVAKR